MRHRNKYNQSDIGAPIIGGTIGIGVVIAPVMPDRFRWFVGWGILTTLFCGLR